MPKCRLCSRDQPDLNADQICGDCAEAHALPPRTEPLRPHIPCIRCNHTKIVRVNVLRERSAEGGDYVSTYIAPLAATFAHDVTHTFWAQRAVSKADVKRPVGVFEAYICRKCGYTELYTRDAASIPIGPEYATEELDMSGATPYR